MDAIDFLQKIVFKFAMYHDPRTGELFFVVDGADTRMN